MHLIRVFTNVTETSEYLRDKCLDRATSAAQSVSVTGSKPFSYRLISVNTMLTLYLKHAKYTLSSQSTSGDAPGRAVHSRN